MTSIAALAALGELPVENESATMPAEVSVPHVPGDTYDPIAEWLGQPRESGGLAHPIGDRTPDESVAITLFGTPNRRRWPLAVLSVVLAVIAALAFAVGVMYLTDHFDIVGFLPNATSALRRDFAEAAAFAFGVIAATGSWFVLRSIRSRRTGQVAALS